LREECRLRVFENRVLRRIFGPKREEVTGEWRRLHNKELYATYSSPSNVPVIKQKIMRWAELIAHMRERTVYRNFVGRSEERIPHGRTMRRWKHNIKMDLQELGRGHGQD
jgi:hypothetical protein